MTAVDGSLVSLEVDTIRIHSETPGAVEFARQLRQALEHDGISVVAPR